MDRTRIFIVFTEVLKSLPSSLFFLLIFLQRRDYAICVFGFSELGHLEFLMTCLRVVVSNS